MTSRQRAIMTFSFEEWNIFFVDVCFLLDLLDNMSSAFKRHLSHKQCTADEPLRFCGYFFFFIFTRRLDCVHISSLKLSTAFGAMRTHPFHICRHRVGMFEWVLQPTIAQKMDDVTHIFLIYRINRRTSFKMYATWEFMRKCIQKRQRIIRFWLYSIVMLLRSECKKKYETNVVFDRDVYIWNGYGWIPEITKLRTPSSQEKLLLFEINVFCCCNEKIFTTWKT